MKTDDYILADGLHEAIIGQDTWEAAGAKRKKTGVPGVKTDSPDHEYILTEIIGDEARP